VIRIAPNELHVNDPEVFQDITKVGSRFIKDPWFYGFVTFPGTSIGETDPSKHRVRRLVLSPAFSPQRVHELAPMVKEKTDFLLRRFSEISAAGKPVNIFNATKAFIMDVISQVIFGKELKCMEDPNFRNQFIEFLHASFDMGWLAPAFPNVFKFFFSMPDWIATRLFPIPLHEFKKVRIRRSVLGL
jgi:cytochrome P450